MKKKKNEPWYKNKLVWVVSSPLVLGLIIYAVLNVLNTFSLQGARNASQADAAASDFLSVSGSQLMYKGQPARLQGANVHNIPWTNSWKGDVSSIQITELDYAEMEKMGGNSFRFGMNFGWYTYQRDRFWQALDQQVAWARKHNVWLILNLFSTPNDQESSGWKCNDLASQEGKLSEFWQAVATRYKNEPAVAGYDVINEPGWCSGNGGWDYWFNMAERIGQKINAISPNQIVTISSNDGGTFPRKLNVSNLLYQMHHYEPGAGTHCYNSRTQQFTYPGTMGTWGDGNVYWSKEAMSAANTGNNPASFEYNVPVQWARSNNVPLYVGEWGMASDYCVRGAPDYVRDTGDLMIRYNVSQSYYVWKHNETYWGIFDEFSVTPRPYTQARYDAVKASFAGAVRPSFGSAGPINTPTATQVRTPNPSTNPTSAPPTNTSGIPSTIVNGLREGGVALVYGWWDFEHYNPTEFDADLPQIKTKGGGHVRLTMSMNTIESGTTGTVRNDRWQDLITFVNKAKAAGLVTIIDVHDTGLYDPGGTDWTSDYMGQLRNSAVRKRHLDLLTEVARRANTDLDKNWIVLQPANEPILNVGTEDRIWYDHQNTLIPQMRAACPSCVLFIMANEWQQVETTVLSLRQRTTFTWDARMIPDMHLYDPLALTHCSYPGQPNNCPGKTWPGTYDGSRYDKAWVTNFLKDLWTWKRNNNLTVVHFSEIGTAADLADNVRGAYLSDLIGELAANGAGWSCWEWKGNEFGIKNHTNAEAACLGTRGIPMGGPSPTDPPSTTPPATTPTPQPPVPPANSTYLPKLHVEGKWMKDPAGNNVVLRGLALFDFKFVADRSRAIRADWKYVMDRPFALGMEPKVYRIMVSPSIFAANSSTYVQNYLDPSIAYCVTKRIYCIIDWHPISDYQGMDSQTRAFWTQVAGRYKNNPNVLYEVFNEPINPNDWNTWKSTAQPWVNLIRSLAPENIILIGGPSWSHNLAGAATNPFTGTNLAYVVHTYPQENFNSTFSVIQTVAAVHPVIVTEWGFQSGAPDPTNGTVSGFGQPLKNFLDNTVPNVGWTAWIFDPESDPNMVDDNWNLLGGNNEMGVFTRDWLYEKRNSYQPGAGGGTVPSTTPTSRPTTPTATRPGSTPNPPISTPIPTPQPPATTGNSLLTVSAGGTIGGGRLPRFMVTADGGNYGTFQVDSQNSHNYIVSIPANSKKIRIIYNDDYYVNGEDRNLKIDSISFNGRTYATSDPSVYSEGVWTLLSGCKGGYKRSPWLACNGYFEYVVTGGSGNYWTPAPTFNGGDTGSGTYPRVLNGTNNQLRIVEVKPRVGNTVYLRIEPNTSLNIIKTEGWLNGRWATNDNSAPFYLGSESGGFTLPGSGTPIRFIGYYNSWNYIETTVTYNY